MLDPRFLDELISEHTADSLRDILRRYDLAPINHAYIIAATTATTSAPDNPTRTVFVGGKMYTTTTVGDTTYIN